MKEINDRGSVINRINTVMADFIATVLGAKLNYKLRYYHHRHRWPDFKHPQDLSERILAAMLKPDFVKYADLADKIKVRDYVRAKGLEAILLEQYGSWARPEDIDWDSLPEKFILKANNGCGGHVVCTDKATIDKNWVNTLMNENLNVKNLSRVEPQYAAIEPRILCEELMGDGNVLPEDYKFMCVNGKVDHILVIGSRESGAKKCTMSKEWELRPYIHKEKWPETLPEKPQHLDEMIRMAEILSADFEFVRVDLYDLGDRICFGELTFSPNGGFMYSYTNEAIVEIGKHFNN